MNMLTDLRNESREVAVLRDVVRSRQTELGKVVFKAEKKKKMYTVSYNGRNEKELINEQVDKEY